MRNFLRTRGADLLPLLTAIAFLAILALSGLSTLKEPAGATARRPSAKEPVLSKMGLAPLGTPALRERKK